MRAPFQILAIPYKKGEELKYCILRRSDSSQWQFVAGGGEDNDTPEEAAIREVSEEVGIITKKIIRLTSMAYLPVDIIKEIHRKHWLNTYVIPEYCFAFECFDEIKLSNEHTKYSWVTYEEALRLLAWDSNKTALYELNCRLLAES